MFVIDELLDENIAFLQHHKEGFGRREFQDLIELIEREISQCFVKSVKIAFDRLRIGVWTWLGPQWVHNVIDGDSSVHVLK